MKAYEGRRRWRSGSQRLQERRCAAPRRFGAFLEAGVEPAASGPGAAPPVNRQAHIRAALRGMPNICFISWEKKEKEPADSFLPLLGSELRGRGTRSHLRIFSIAEQRVGLWESWCAGIGVPHSGPLHKGRA